MAFRYIDSLIYANTSIRSTTYYSNAVAKIGYRDFIRIGKSESPWYDLYSFYGGQIVWNSDSTQTSYYDSTRYAGYDSIGTYPITYGLQRALNHFVTDRLDSIAFLLNNMSPPKIWLYTPQAWAGRARQYCTSEWKYRLPTRSEYSCSIFLGFCYGMSGLALWKYDGIYNDTDHTKGFIDPGDSFSCTDIWKEHHHNVNPYVKAIDSTYLSLTWHSAYPINFEYNFDPPPGAWIDTIYAVSDTPNPDLGWFHLGQYTEGSDKYVMIVNRACSEGPEDTDPAPPITATIKFEPEYLQLGNYVEIIDIADSVVYCSYDSILVFPETTYVSAQNGLLTYVTEFEPGEGRLFKIIEVDDNFTNPVTDSVVLSKDIILLEDLVVHDTGILVIDQGVNIFAHPDSDVTLINYGKIIANGSSSDSI